MTCTCPQCKTLLENQGISLHSGLIEINHIHNNTLYECKYCYSQIGLVSVPHRWEMVSSAPKQQVA